MPTLRSFRPARPPAPRRAHCSAPVSAALALMVGLAFCALTCGGSSSSSRTSSLVNQVCPSDPQRTGDNPAMTPMEFCQVYVQTCMGTNTPPGGYITEAECEAAYTGLMFDSTRECRSYHLCNAAAYDTMNALMHCGHSIGVGLCLDTGP